jgi:hypothetical protein
MYIKRKMQRRHIIAVSLLLITILSCLIFYFSLPGTRLDVSGFPTSQNYGTYTAFGPSYEAGSYVIINNSYQVHNIGNVNASNIQVKFNVYPADTSKTCKIISISIYTDEPTPTNLLTIVKDKNEYTIATLNPDAKVIFVFQIKSTNLHSDTKYVLNVDSANAGSFYREVLSQGKYGSTVHEQRWPWW